jgi:hypothetical protein
MQAVRKRRRKKGEGKGEGQTEGAAFSLVYNPYLERK